LKNIGILAIQGDFAKHAEMIENIGHNALEIRTREQLWQAEALIIPGGESSTLLKIINRFDLYKEIQKFASTRPVMGTCAGLIILANKADHLDSRPLDLIDIAVSRNAYGRQLDSFVDDISLNLNGQVKSFSGVFIRAPKIISQGPDVKTLGMHGDQVVMAASRNIVVCTFHPELTDDTSVHKYFINNYLKV
jgi:pyridoxal 5'-phosphate synthase pdxT subunit